MVDGRGNKRSISCSPDEVLILRKKGEGTRETTKKTVAMRPRHFDPLCNEVCHDDELDQVDASKPRPRPSRPHSGEELGPNVTGNDIVTLLGHRPTRTQPQGRRVILPRRQTKDSKAQRPLA